VWFESSVTGDFRLSNVEVVSIALNSRWKIPTTRFEKLDWFERILSSSKTRFHLASFSTSMMQTIFVNTARQSKMSSKMSESLFGF